MIKEIRKSNIAELRTTEFTLLNMTDPQCTMGSFYFMACYDSMVKDWFCIDSADGQWMWMSKNTIIEKAEKFLQAESALVLISDI